MRHTSVCSGASEPGARGAGSPDPRHHLQASGFPRPRSGQCPRGPRGRCLLNPQPLLNPKEEILSLWTSTSFPSPQVSEVDFASAGTAGPHSCGSSNRGTREARGRRRDRLVQPVSPGLCHFKTLDGISGRRQETRVEHAERGEWTPRDSSTSRQGASRGAR